MPYAPPELAWSFNRDPEALPGLLEQYAKEMKIDLAEKRKQRAALVQLAHPQEGWMPCRKSFQERAITLRESSRRYRRIRRGDPVGRPPPPHDE